MWEPAGHLTACKTAHLLPDTSLERMHVLVDLDPDFVLFLSGSRVSLLVHDGPGHAAGSIPRYLVAMVVAEPKQMRAETFPVSPVHFFEA